MAGARRHRGSRNVWVVALSLLLGLASPSWSDTSVDLGDLNIPRQRLPRWHAAEQAETFYESARTWAEYDATCPVSPCPSGKTGFREAPGDPMATCSPVDPADDGGEDWEEINCLIASAANNSVIYLPQGTYDMGSDTGDTIKIARSRIVLRGEGPSRTHLRITHPIQGSPDCSDSDWSSNTLCGAGIVGVGAVGYEGPAVAWTSGFEQGATLIKVADAQEFTLPGWIALEIQEAQDDCEIFLPKPAKDPRNNNHAIGQIARITSITGNFLTIDRGIRIDYTLDPGCTATAVARPYRPIEAVGLEGIRFTTARTLDPDALKSIGFVTFGAGTTHSWAVGNLFDRAEAGVFGFVGSARNWFQGNRIRNYGRIDENFNTSGVNMKSRSTDNVVENNAWRDFVVGVNNNQGAQGGVIAYNYMRHGNPPNTPERALFNHGLYTREMLFEGNDVDGVIVTGDPFWGSNGPRLTVYRNRNVATDWRGGVVMNRDGGGTWPIADRVNWLGNIASYYYTTAECNAINFPGCMSQAHDFDGTSYIDEDTGLLETVFVTNMWVEKNVFRDTDTCPGDPTPGRCGFHQDTPRPDTSCGTGPGDCASGTGNNGGGDAAPASWANDDVPHSLYRFSETPPIWWCQEACAWADVHQGIGAWGDDFSTNLCKLPAQILAEGGICTPIP